MVDIKWVDGSVCFAGGEQWYSCNENEVKLISENQSMLSFEEVLSFESFQLNEIRQGDYIEASELDTEQKYNDAVEVFELFGVKPYLNCDVSKRDFIKQALNYGEGLIVDDELDLVIDYNGVNDISQKIRKITHPQLMAIGKLKQAMIECDEALIDAVENTSILKDTLGSAKDYTPAVTIEGENTKESRAYDILESMNIFYDEEKEKWYKKEYL